MTPTTDFDFYSDEHDEIRNSNHIVQAICDAASDTGYSLDRNPYNPYTEIRLHDEYNAFYRMAWLNRDLLKQTFTFKVPRAKDMHSIYPEEDAEIVNEILAELEC